VYAVATFLHTLVIYVNNCKLLVTTGGVTIVRYVFISIEVIIGYKS